MDRSELILPLSSSKATLGRAGGKGANLASLSRAGFPVPDGFVVTSDAYRHFLLHNNIPPRLQQIVEGVTADRLHLVEVASAQIRALFEAGELPEDIATGISQAYEHLRDSGDEPPVAVRSSASAEDLPWFSFAGQQDTYLNIEGREHLLSAIRSCWGSLWTARAIAYRVHNRIESRDLTLAVIVQKMIDAEVSGVTFTANPLTGHRGETVVDAAFGLGEAIVSGKVEPDRYVVDHRAMRISFRKLGAKALLMLPAEGGGTRSVSCDRGQEQALSDTQILDLVRISRDVAEHYGSPQDVEWAMRDGHFYLLQSRPITSLYPLPDAVLNRDDLRVFVSLNSLQGVIEPFTPLGHDLMCSLLNGLLQSVGVVPRGQDVTMVAAGRIFIDVTGLACDRRLRKVLLVMLGNGDPGARDVLLDLIRAGRIELTNEVSRRELFRFVLGLRPVIARMSLTWLWPAARRKRALSKVDRCVEEMRTAANKASSLQACLTLIGQHISIVLFHVILKNLGPVLIPGLLSQVLADRLLKRWLNTPSRTVQRLLRGLPGNPTTEMDLRLWDAARAIRADPESMALFRTHDVDEIVSAYHTGKLPEAARTAIEAFLADYGMRAIVEIDIGRPRWREDPRALIQNLRGYLDIDKAELAPDRVFQAAASEAETLSAQYVAKVARQKGALRARILRAILFRMRLLAGLREMPKFYMIKTLDTFRSALLRAGSGLVECGQLERAEDVFYVPLNVLHIVASGGSCDLKGAVDRHRAEYDRERIRRRIPRLLLSTGETFYSAITEASGNDLTGDGVSPGVVEGKVHVIHDPRGEHLEPGEILVCPATDPGWTPLFLAAKGLVMELGGMMTHGSVVAREYGIPAVVGVHEATTRLKTGQTVRVDGSAGRVVILEDEPSSQAE